MASEEGIETLKDGIISREELTSVYPKIREYSNQYNKDALESTLNNIQKYKDKDALKTALEI